jgi:hypothetical protein
MKKAKDSNIERHQIELIELKARDRATLLAMAKRYGVNDLIDFLEGIVILAARPSSRVLGKAARPERAIGS